MTESADVFTGLQVQRLRESQKLLQADLAEQLQAEGLNWSQTTLSRVERGDRPVRLNEGAILARVLRVGVAELLPGSAMLQSARQRQEWSLQAIEEQRLDLETEFRWASNSRVGLLLLEALADGRPGPFRVNVTLNSFLMGLVNVNDQSRISRSQLYSAVGISYADQERSNSEADAALDEWRNGGAFPEWAQRWLDFVDTETSDGVWAEIFREARLEDLFARRFPNVVFAEEGYPDDFEGKLIEIDGLDSNEQ